MTFNGVAFKDPSEMEDDPWINQDVRRSINGNVVVDTFFSPKQVKILTFNELTESEYNTLFGYCTAGTKIPVVLTVTGHAFNYSTATVQLLSAPTHGFSGRREKIKISVSE